MFDDGVFVIGANYWASHAATAMWSQWSAETVDRDFALLAQYGCTLVRVFPLWSDFQPITLMRRVGVPGGTPVEVRMGEAKLPDTPAGRCGVDERMLERFECLADLSGKHGLKLIVPLLTGHMTMRLFVPPALAGLDLYTDPLALKYEAKFIECFVSRMRHHPAIAAWESGNETNFLSSVTCPEAAWAWSCFIHNQIRRFDDSRPVIGCSGLAITPESGMWLIRDITELSDLLAVHPYPMWSNAGREEAGQIRNLCYAAVEHRLVEEIGGKRCFVEETGYRRAIATTTSGMGRIARGMLWNLWRENCRAMLWWCAFDQTVFDHAPYDWDFPALEHGIFREDGTPHPIAETFRGFLRFLETLPSGELPAVKPDAVCIVSENEIAHGAFVLARQAGINLAFASPLEPLPESAVYFLPSARNRAQLGTLRWRELLERVREGATLYLSLDDTYLDHLEELCSAGILGRIEQPGRIAVEGEAFRFEFPVKVRRRMVAEGATVLARDADGDPVFFRSNFGRGKVFTCAYPLERIAMENAGLFDSEMFRIYAAVVVKRPLLNVGECRITVTEHFFSENRALCVIVNGSGEELEVHVETAPGWHPGATYSDLAEARLTGGRLLLPPCAGIAVEMIRSGCEA